MGNSLLIDFEDYKPGRFEYLTKYPFARSIWDFLITNDSINLMSKAVSDNKPAIFYLLEKIESDFGTWLSSKEFPGDDVCVLVNNMILQIMESRGYEHFSCGLMPSAKYIKSSGVYREKVLITN